MVVRYDNGEYEGFSGAGFSKDIAQVNAEKKMLNKISWIKQSRKNATAKTLLKTEYDKLSEDIKKQIKSDWMIE